MSATNAPCMLTSPNVRFSPRRLAVSEHSSLRAGIFKASGSADNINAFTARTHYHPPAIPLWDRINLTASRTMGLTPRFTQRRLYENPDDWFDSFGRGGFRPPRR